MANKFVKWFFDIDDQYTPEPAHFVSRRINKLDATPYSILAMMINSFTSISEILTPALVVLKILGYFNYSWFFVFLPVIIRAFVVLVERSVEYWLDKKGQELYEEYWHEQAAIYDAENPEEICEDEEDV